MKILKTTLLALPLLFAIGCDDDEGMNEPMITPVASKTYVLNAVSNPSISGDATVIKNSDNTITVELDLDGTPSGGSHPAHIHFNTAAEGGGIAVSLTAVDGSTGMSSTTFTTLDDGTSISYEQLLDFDGYINVHASANDLSTLVAQGDIGQNELTGMSEMYTLNAVADANISGQATFYERVNGETLIVSMLNNTPMGGMHPGHIHFNTAAEGGGIAVTLTTLDGTTGMSKTNVSTLDDGTMVTYDDMIDFDGYINFHLSSSDLATLVGQGDIGQNALTGNSETYTLNAVADANISGQATFYERVNGETLIVSMLDNTPMGGMHPGHIHFNTAAEGGGIAVTLTTLNGTTGMSKTNVSMLDDGTMVTYDDMIDFDGYINFHLSSSDLATLVGQGDIGQNALTGTSTSYMLNAVDYPNISGMVMFSERVNGEALATLMLDNTPAGVMHPAHIHANDAATGGPIIFTFNSVNGDTGMSKTNVSMLDDGTSFMYSDVLTVDGYINVHYSATNLAQLVGQGNIGVNN